MKLLFFSLYARFCNEIIYKYIYQKLYIKNYFTLKTYSLLTITKIKL